MRRSVRTQCPCRKVEAEFFVGMPPKQTKRKRTRKSRTAVISDSESSDSDQAPQGKPVDQEEQPEEGITQDVRESDDSDDDEPQIPEIHLSTGDAAAHAQEAPAPTFTTQQAEKFIDESTRASFRQLWMQSLTDEFGDQLDELRKSDPRFSDPSSASIYLPLLIDSLAFSSEVLGDHAEQVDLVMPNTTD